MTDHSGSLPNVRTGTAMRRSGKATARRILAAAREVLRREGYAQFSMRTVAEGAGVHLANLQYYFPRRDDLVRAILAETGEMYQRAYDDLLKDTPAEPIERFKVVLRYQIEDIFLAETRQFFVQLWALLSTIDDTPGELLGELYAIDIAQLGECISALEPALEKHEVEKRATLLAAMVEGLMIVRGPVTNKDRIGKSLSEAAIRLGVNIARGRGLE